MLDNPWDVDRRDYPAQATPSERLTHLVRYAVLAPSSHNTQPWRFTLEGDSLALHADTERRLPVVDPDERELVISCGAALENLLVAARGVGEAVQVNLLPDPSDPALLATVTLTGASEVHPDDLRLLGAITLRRTTREAFDELPVPAMLAAELERIGLAEGVTVSLVRDRTTREKIATLVSEGDRQQFADPAFRGELAAWIRSRRSMRRDGLSGEGFDMPDSLSGIGALVIRTFDLGRGVAAHDREIAEGSLLLAILSTDRDDSHSWLATGRTLERLLLRAAASGISASYLNQPIEVASLRPAIAALPGVAQYPQLVLRLGYARSTRPASRRSVDQVLERS